MKDKEMIVTSGNEKLKRLSDLLERSLKIYEEDRDRAIRNYETFKNKLDDLYAGSGDEDDDGVDMTQDAALEDQCNKALNLVFKASDKLDKVIDAVTKIITTQLMSESREKIADKFSSGGGSLIPKRPVNFAELINRNKTQTLDYDEEEEDIK